MATDADNTGDQTTHTPGDVAALLERADAILAAEEDRAFEAREAALVADFTRARNELIRVLARGAELVRLRDGKLSPRARQHHEALAGEIAQLVELLGGRAHA
jgi:hypothetical protein